MNIRKIEAIIPASKLKEVTDALNEIVDGLTVTVVSLQAGTVSQKYRGSEYRYQTPTVKVEVVATHAEEPGVLDAITRAARTGRLGDGKIFVYDVADAFRIRNGQCGVAAL